MRDSSNHSKRWPGIPWHRRTATVASNPSAFDSHSQNNSSHCEQISKSSLEHYRIQSNAPENLLIGERKCSYDPTTHKEELQMKTSYRSWPFWRNSSYPVIHSKTDDKNKTSNRECPGVQSSQTISTRGLTLDQLNVGLSHRKHELSTVLPSIRCLPLKHSTTMLFDRFYKFSSLLGIDSSVSSCLYRLPEPRKPQRVVIIGIHGFFPTKVLRPLIGEPTGTSVKFSNEAEQAVRDWAKEHNADITIQKIALEKEGNVISRVEFFLNEMKNWTEDINKADFVFFAAHSQGTPVSIILLAQLLSEGIIDDKRTIGILAMAGISNGPFFGIDQRFFVRAYSTIENESMMELFEFQNMKTPLSKLYVQSIREIISHGAKIVFVGSIDDQLVPLYSALAFHVRHPNIFRAAYIDGCSKTPKFVSDTVSICCTLYNLGFSDHGVLKEISPVLAGPLTGGGHSKIYNERGVYELALQFFLETTNFNDYFPKQPVIIKHFELKFLAANPFHLPWCMRGLMFEAHKFLPSGKSKVENILTEFNNWNPDSKSLKDMKYRLNGLGAKF
ncbi:BA75_03364T0 [Komagataella pastoris]|uniref:BA75_03364T0 n=1 Tax=Komagataella pastoris TaxID=4922 RepID=A0A1B2JFK4_PICPA|nr:BA75_03364T0 [Komagataella pastoris]